MALTRRDVLRLGGGAAVASAMLPAGEAGGFERCGAGYRAEFTGGAMRRGTGGLVLEVPEIADNGGAVPVRVAAEGASGASPSSPKRIRVPGVAVFAFGRLATPAASTRIRLAGSQNVIAVAEMADGTYRMASRAIAVTAGGCG